MVRLLAFALDLAIAPATLADAARDSAVAAIKADPAVVDAKRDRSRLLLFVSSKGAEKVGARIVWEPFDRFAERTCRVALAHGVRPRKGAPYFGAGVHDAADWLEKGRRTSLGGTGCK